MVQTTVFTSSLFLSALFGCSLLPLVNAHGQILGVSANGVYNDGPNIYYSGDAKNAKTAVRTMYEASGPSYNLPTDFTDDSKMACEGASGAPVTIQVSAGSDMQIDWVGATSDLLNQPGTGDKTWPDGEYPWVHAMGTVATYIASCTNGDCTTFDASEGSWVKLEMDGIDLSQSISDDLRSTMAAKPEEYYPTGAGLWGMAKFVQDGSSWNVTVPSGLQNGQYIVRHELMAVHNPLTSSDATTGPQVYVGCIQVEVVDGGDVTLPEGTKAGSLYAADGDFAQYNVYSDNGANFVNPGPAVWDGASSSSSSSTSASSASTTSTNVSTSSSSTVYTSSSAATASIAAAAVASPTTTSVDEASNSTTSASASASTSSGACRRRRDVKRMMRKRHSSSFHETH
ncbi:glycoside hydrolase family 61 protein [Lentinula aciculospora]|uniref:lytic cellulose monooxygenase (C4-dehydrogenating) n=1 Tax=Lentinula aciculospora TaxID=153920 RepID=A0A9W9A5M4_9AGAR|nr:glycoside hydrolase family 61 protein [Lentinula aciculospora]